MKRFVCYIGCAALVFKLMYGAAWAAGATAGDTAAPENGGAAVSAETAAAAVSAVRDTLPGTAAAAVSEVRDTVSGPAAAAIRAAAKWAAAKRAAAIRAVRAKRRSRLSGATTNWPNWRCCRLLSTRFLQGRRLTAI